MALLSILFMLMALGSWTLSMSVMMAMVPMVATTLYSPILSPKLVLPMLGGDNLTWSLVLLTLWVSALSLMSSTYIYHTYKDYDAFLRLVMMLTIILVLAFTVTNFLSFYLLFEAALIPITIIIIVWGSSPERLQAGMYIMIYTVSASLPLLMILLYTLSSHGTLFFYMPYNGLSPFFLMIMSMAMLVKFPLYGVHLWLPKAHVEAPVGGSMLLAGLLLKLGPYGIMRMMVFLPNYYTLSTILTTWGIMSSIAASFICVRQMDMKSLVAYASVSHMGMVLAGLMSYTHAGWTGATIMIIGHGLASSGLFALVWCVYEWTGSRSLIVNRGMHHAAPALALFWFLMVAANMGIPPTLNMAGEVYIFSGLVAVVTEPPIMFGALILYSVLTMIYSLALYTNVNHGSLSPHVNYIWQRPIYFTISFLHLVPLVLAFFALPIMF